LRQYNNDVRQKSFDSDDLHKEALKPVPEEKTAINFSSLGQTTHLQSVQPKHLAPLPPGSHKQPTPPVLSRFDNLHPADYQMEPVHASGFHGPQKAVNPDSSEFNQKLQSRPAFVQQPPQHNPKISSLIGQETYGAGFERFAGLEAQNHQNQQSNLNQYKSNLNPIREVTEHPASEMNIFPSSLGAAPNPAGSTHQKPPPPPNAQQKGGVSDIHWSSAQQHSEANAFQPQTPNPLQSNQNPSQGTAQFHQPTHQDPRVGQQSAIFNQPNRFPAQSQPGAPRSDLNPPLRDQPQPFPPSNRPGQPQPQPSTTGSRLNKDLSGWNVAPISPPPAPAQTSNLNAPTRLG